MLAHAVIVTLSVATAAPAHAAESSAEHQMSKSLGWLIGTWEEAGSRERPGAPAATMSFHWKAGKEVVLWEGTYAAEEATWSFVATIFFDRHKDRLRVFAFNSHGQRHLGLLKEATPDKLAWTMSGLRADGRKERFVAEFVRRGDGTVDFNLKDRRPADEDMGGDSTIRLRRVDGSLKETEVSGTAP